MLKKLQAWLVFKMLKDQLPEVRMVTMNGRISVAVFAQNKYLMMRGLHEILEENQDDN